VTLNAGSATAVFADANAGTGKPVTVTGCSLGGLDAANYVLTQPAASATITPATLTYFANTASRAYGSANPAFAGSVSGFVGTDTQANATAGSLTFTSSAISTSPVGHYAINGSGLTANNGNYTFAQAAANATALTVTPALLTIASGVAAQDKAYDGTTAAALSTNDVVFAGLIGADMVSLVTNGYTATFASAEIGTNIAVTVSGLTLSGPNATNYTLAQPSGLTATITPAALTVTGITASDKVYDGTTAATLNVTGATLQGVTNGDAVALDTSAATGAFGDPNAGTGKIVTVSGLTLTGTNAGNYTLTQPTATANIMQAILTVTADNQTKQQGDANPALTASYVGFVNGEGATVLSGSPDLSTTVTTDTAAGVYPITAALGSLSAANYSFAFQDGQFTVTAPPAQPSPAIAMLRPTLALATVPPARLTGIQVLSTGVRITFTGSAGSTYQIQRAAALQFKGTAWTNIGSATTDGTGQGEFTDTNPTPGQGYYRTVSQ
jgi:hypothetical protein